MHGTSINPWILSFAAARMVAAIAGFTCLSSPQSSPQSSRCCAGTSVSRNAGRAVMMQRSRVAWEAPARVIAPRWPVFVPRGGVGPHFNFCLFCGDRAWFCKFSGWHAPCNVSVVH